MPALIAAIASAARFLPAKAFAVVAEVAVVVVRVVTVVVGIVDTAPARVR